MKIIFFGTPEFVVPILEALHHTYNKGRERNLIGVVTQPPRPVGRDKVVQYSPVDHFAYKHKIPVYHSVEELPEADLGICAAYGSIIPGNVIAAFTYGILNVHPSLLPKFRGASPIQATIASGETHTGVTIIRMDEALDHGPIVSVIKDEVLPEDTNETLRDRLFEKSAEFVLGLIHPYVSGKIQLKVQDHESATFTKVIKRDDGYIPGSIIKSALHGETTKEELELPFIKDFSVNAEPTAIQNMFRALSPWPGVWTKVLLSTTNPVEKRLKILEMHISEDKLVLDQVQLEGKNPVSWMQFTLGYPDFSFL